MENASSAHETVLADLVSLWQRRRAEGQTATPAELCGDHPELLTELEQRIAGLERMDNLAGAMNQTMTLRTLVAAQTPAAPAHWPNVAGYEILGELGRGGMGVVYKARQTQLGRIIALKMILAGGHASDEGLTRFRIEAKAIARLQHPYIVQIHEVGEHDGLPYFSLEFCAGGSLDKKLGGTPLPPLEAAKLVQKLAQAMQAAHEKGVVHRDLKPANVLLAEDGSPKVTDFGLAKRLDEAVQTVSGALIGTPPYMAPEQVGGQKGTVGPAVDVYALGAILYECLTGRPPFLAPTTLETLRKVASEEPVPPSQLQLRTPRDLETICLKCLQKEPTKRYASAQDLAEDLQRFQDGEPIRARPIGRMERGWRWCRRNPTVAASLLIVALSLVTATIVSTVFGFRAEQARRAEATQALNEATARQEADQARSDAQRQLVELCQSSGMTAAREGDHSLALLWFVRALQLAKDDPQQEGLNRIRIANWLRQVCLPEETFSVPGFRQNLDRFRMFQFSPDGNYLLVIASTGGCLVWDRPHARFVELPGAAAQATAAAWQPGSNLLAVAEKSGLIRFLAAPDFRPVEEVTASGQIAVLAFSRDGKRLAWGGSDGARVWDPDKKEYLTPLFPHGGQVVALAFSSGADRLATASRDKKARVFRIPSEGGEPLFSPVPHIGDDGDYSHTGPDVACPRFAAGDQVFLTVEEIQKNVASLVWRSVETGKPLSDATSLDYRHFGVFTVSEDGDYVAALGPDKGRIWDAQSRRLLATIPGPPPLSWNEHVTFSADGKTLVTCGHDTRARFWYVEDRFGDNLTASSSSIYHPMQAVRVNLSPDGRHLATGLWDGTVYLWRCPAGTPTMYSLPVNGSSLAALSPDKRFVLPRGLTYRNGTLNRTQVYEAESGKAAGPLLDPSGILLDAAFSPDGTRVATASSTAPTPRERNQRLFQPQGKGGNVQIWDWKMGQRVAGPIPTPGEPRGLAFRRDGHTLAIVCADYRVLLVDPKSGTITHSLDPGLRTRPQNANQWFSNGEARFSPDGRFLVTWEMTPHVHVWDPDRGQLLHTLPHTERIHHICFNPASPELMATIGWGSEARIWNLTTGKLVVALKHPQWVSQIQFASEGKELITGCDDGVLRVWDWQANRLKEGWPLHPSAVQDFRFLADRRALVSLDHWGLQVTDWRTKIPITPLGDHRPDFNLTVEIASGDHQAIVGGLGSLLAYDLDTMLTPTKAPAEELLRLAELSAGRRILSQGNIVPLNRVEWLERWRHLQREDAPTLLESVRPSPSDEQRRQARRLVASLFERLIRKSAVLHSLRFDANLGEDLRAEAMAQAERHPQEPSDLNELAWFAVRSPDGSPEKYARALLQADEACSLLPGNGVLLNTLGVAQYRVGKYREAIETLTRSDKLNRAAFGKSLPADLAFLSMAQHRLGQKQQALATFEQLRQIMSASDQIKAPTAAAEDAMRNENRAFFKEAGETILGKDWISQPNKMEKKSP
jgi:WD40 repeat protein/tetratricopeptide (TPR) repeat protein